MKFHYDRKTRNYSFSGGESVWVNNPLNKGSSPGHILKQTAPNSYLVEVDGVQRGKHGDQLRERPQTRERQSSLNQENEQTTVKDDCEQSAFSDENEAEQDVAEEVFEEASEVSQEAKFVSRTNSPRNRQMPARYPDTIL